MSIYVIPALFALLIKVFVIFWYRKSVEANPYFIAIVITFALHNLSELLLVWGFFAGITAEYILRTYYLVSVVSLLTIFIYAAHISGKFSKRWLLNLWCVVALYGFALFGTNLIVSGVTSIGYSATAMRGDFYGVFQLLSVGLLGLTFTALYRGYRSTNTHDTQIKCAYTGLALIPHVLAVIVIVVMMNIGLEVNAIMVLPIATTLFLFILLASENKHRITDIRRFIPFSEERQTSNEIMEIFSDYARDRISYREAVNDIEKLLVEHKYQKTDFNASSTAQLMGMPRSSLYSLFNRLDIKRD